MCKENMKTFFIIFLLVGLLLVLPVNCGNLSQVPLWLKDGVFVTYMGDRANIEFFNGTTITGESGTFLKWVCLNVNDSLAKLKVSVSLVDGNRSFNVSMYVFVDFNNRDVYSEKGEYCGKTMLWLPTNLEEGDTVVFGLPGSFVEGTIAEKGKGHVKTPYGYQETFRAEFDTDKPVNVTYGNKTYEYRLWNWLSYDLDTGLLIAMAGLRAEGVLYALGIWMLPSLNLIYETNVDLGPSLILPEILDVFWVVPPILFFVFVFFFVYWKRRKRRKMIRKLRRQVSAVIIMLKMFRIIDVDKLAEM